MDKTLTKSLLNKLKRKDNWQKNRNWSLRDY